MNKFKKIKPIASKDFLRLWSTNVEFIDQRLEPHTAEITLNHAVDFNVIKLSKNYVIITAKRALTAAMVTKDQNRIWALTAAVVNKVRDGIKDTIAILDHTCTTSKELSAKANKKPLNLYKKTKCSFLITEPRVLHYLRDEAVAQIKKVILLCSLLQEV